MAYNFTEIEKKWQKHWLENKTFATLDPSEAVGLPKAYILDMFPYPSGAGLHVGHPLGYTATDIVSRFRRMQGYNVLHPMGWDAFGLPAEQYAVKNNVHPAETTRKNIDTFRRQIQMLGLSYDWDREVDTTDPKYYRWTQWIFLQLFNSYFDPIENRAMPISHLTQDGCSTSGWSSRPDNSAASCVRLMQLGMDAIAGDVRIESLFRELSPLRNAARSHRRPAAGVRRRAARQLVPWPLGTVLANEEDIDGHSEVGGFPVEKRPMRQWMLRITAYADRLVKDLDLVNWPESLKEMQRRTGSAEASVPKSILRLPRRTFRHQKLKITAMHRRSPKHNGFHHPARYAAWGHIHGAGPSSTRWSIRSPTPARTHREAIAAYRTMKSPGRSDRDRMADAKEKTGVFTGAYAINPVNEERLPIYIADYVMLSYGTGAIMAVPAHDARDLEFAKKYNLPIRAVVAARPRPAMLPQG